jgi:type IV pilus assembly protein PilB
MNIAEHRRPQDGSFTIRYKNKDYDFRINTLPVSDKEKMVIRVLAPAVSISAKKEEITLVGASKEDIQLIQRIHSVPNGIILATGPTGSGKTTTLYTLLKSVNDEGINITTIEDPVEIKIEGINQSQINAKAGITFASCLRAILRQDPDVILIGEIRDYETLEAAISAALTGHVVLSTLHTNSAAATITRLIEMGAKNYLVSSTLAGIVAQRLVRQLCPDCKEQYYASEEEAKLVVSTPDEIKAFMKLPIYRAKGCDKCKFKGYTGRLGVYEILQVSKEIKKLIAQGAHDIEIEEAAVGLGMNTLQQSCLKHIIAGETTIQEFVRVLGPVTD